MAGAWRCSLEKEFSARRRRLISVIEPTVQVQQVVEELISKPQLKGRNKIGFRFVSEEKHLRFDGDCLTTGGSRTEVSFRFAGLIGSCFGCDLVRFDGLRGIFGIGLVCLFPVTVSFFATVMAFVRETLPWRVFFTIPTLTSICN